MKFGKKILDLSIPEWKSHSLDYNDLKGQIKLYNKQEVTLNDLNSKFIVNFDLINLFVKTKYNEVFKKFTFYSHQFYDILNDDAISVDVKTLKLDILVSKLVELSIILKKLSKFILIQKIAVKKIFKKLLKKTDNNMLVCEFILNLKVYLNKNKSSFVNFNLVNLTIKLTNLINLIKFETRKMKNEEDYTESLFESNMGSSNELQINDNVKFDFVANLKQNFKLSFLLPDDSNNFNDFLLNMNIYLNFTGVSSKYSVNSVIYLQNDDDLSGDPSYILSELGVDTSLVVAHVGGLRKFSYCYLPNDIIDLIIKFILDDANTEVEDKLKEYFLDHRVNSLTKLTVDSMLNNKLKPKGKFYYKCLRYYVSKEKPSDQEDNEDNNDDTYVPVSEDYSFSLKYDLFATKSCNRINTTQIEINDDDNLDKFPFHVLEAHSNDANLLNFHENLLTEIKEDNLLENKFSNSLLHKLPTKIQKLIKNNNSINLFKNLDLYLYLLSCYYNVVPKDIYNHYTYILQLNLFKNFEDIEKSNNDMNFDTNVMKDSNDKILRHQLSLNNLEHQATNQKEQEYQVSNYSGDEHRSKRSGSLFRPGLGKNNSVRSLSTYYMTKLPPDGFLVEEFDKVLDNEDNESLKRFWDEEMNLRTARSSRSSLGLNAHLSSFVMNLINLRTKLNRDPESLTHKGLIHQTNTGYNSTAEGNLSNSNDSLGYYDTMDYYYYEHDKILSFFYLTLSSTSIFISSVELGILFSILKLEQSNQLMLFDNIWLLSVILAGIVISMICSLISFNLIFKKFSQITALHFGIVGLSFALIFITLIFLSLLLFI